MAVEGLDDPVVLYFRDGYMGVTGVTSHPSPETEKNYITNNITSQATLLANERV